MSLRYDLYVLLRTLDAPDWCVKNEIIAHTCDYVFCLNKVLLFTDIDKLTTIATAHVIIIQCDNDFAVMVNTDALFTVHKV